MSPLWDCDCATTDRGELKMTTTPPSIETGSPTIADRFFPHIVDSSMDGPRSSSCSAGPRARSSSGTLSFFDTAGEPWDLPTESSVSGSLPPGGDTVADLVVASASVTSETPMPGQSFELMATVRNRGTGESAATTLRYYQSTDATITASDTQVGTAAVGTLAALGSSSASLALTAPAEAGTYYYGACVDTVTGESDTTNNCSGSVGVTVQPATSLVLPLRSIHASGNWGTNELIFPEWEPTAPGHSFPPTTSSGSRACT